MAAHDEKISNNRRRLFKALSAAPVVATLRPGAAMAGTSSYQCLIEPPVPATPVYLQPLPPTCVGGDSGCVAYVERPYWVAPDPPCRQNWNAVVDPGSTGSEYIVIYDPGDPADPSTSQFGKLEVPGYAYTPFTPPTNWAVDGTVLSYPKNSQLDCELTAKTGYFLLKVEPNADHTDFSAVGLFPEEMGDAAWKSCWNSFGKSTTGISFVKG